MTTAGNGRMLVPDPLSFHVADVTVHGQLWQRGGAWVILVHEPGRDKDLDCWRDLPALLAGRGFTAMTFDLPGHGLSDGSPDSTRTTAAIDAALIFAAEKEAVRRFLVVAGDSTGPAVFALVAQHIEALVMLSPHLPEPCFAQFRQVSAPKLILAGRSDVDAAEKVYRESRSWTVISHVGCSETGTDLLSSAWGSRVREQVLNFLTDYR